MSPQKQQEFERDFQWLTQEERWTEADIQEARQAMQKDKSMLRYLWVRSRAGQAGYRFEKETGYETLVSFCARKGLPHP